VSTKVIFRGNINLLAQLEDTTLATIVTPKDSYRFRHLGEAILDMVNGTANGQADVVFWKEETISSAKNWDLAGGNIAPNLAAAGTPTIVELLILAICNKATLASGLTLTLGNDANHVPIFSAVTQSQVIKPQTSIIPIYTKQDGIVVTAGSGDIIRLTPSGSVKYEILMVGRSA
jgi:hypothetical protein